MKINYYDNYWSNKITGGSQNKPPVWDNKNLNWHYIYFKKYIGKKILDVGAGDGTYSNFIKKKSKKSIIDALELSKNAVKIGKKKFKSINFINESLEQLKSINKYDTIFAIEVMEHLFDIDLCLKNIHKALTIKGYFCITTTDFNLLKKIFIATFLLEKYFYPNNPHIRFFTKKSLIDICQKNGFKFIKHQWNKSYFGFMPKGQMIVFQKI